MDAEPQVRRQRKGWRRALGWGLGGLAGVALLSQTPPASTVAARALANAFAPEGLQVEIGRVGWFPITSLGVQGLHVTDAMDQSILAVNRLDIDHHLLSSLMGPISIGTVAVEGAVLTLQDRPGGTWGLGLPQGSDPPAQSDGSGRIIEVARVEVRESRVEVVAAGAGADGPTWSDTTVVLTEVQGSIVELRVAPDEGVIGTVAQLLAVARTGAASEDYSLSIRTAGRLNGRSLALDPFSATGNTSPLTGAATLDWEPVADGGSARLDAELSSPALGPADIRALIPAWAGETAFEVQARMKGPVDSLPITFEAHAVPTDVGSDAPDPLAGSTVGSVTVSSRGATPALGWTFDFAEVDPRIVLGPEGTPGRVSGNTAAWLMGPAPDQWSGNVDVTLTPSRWGEWAIGDSEADLEFTEGLGVGGFELDAENPNTRIRATGDMRTRPFDGPPWIQAEGDLATSARADERLLRVEARYQIEGSGTRPSDLALEAELATRSGQAMRVGRTAFSRTTATVSLAAGAGSWRFEAASEDQAIQGNGTLTLTDTTTSLAARSLVWRDLDVAALVGDTVSSSVSGSLRGELQLAPSRPPSSRGSVRVSGLRYGNVDVDSVEGSWAARDGDLTSNWTVDVDSGRVQTRLVGRPFAAVPQFRLLDGRFERIDLAALLGHDTDSVSGAEVLETRLAGMFSGRWRGREPATATARMDWQLTPSQVQRVDSLTGRGFVDLTGGEAVAEGRFDSPTTAARWAGSARPFAATPSWTLGALEFEGVAIQDWMSAPSPVSATLTGSLEGDGTGFTARDMIGRMTVVLDGSRVGDRHIRSARAALSAESGILGWTASAQLDSAWSAASGTVDLSDDTVRYEADLRAALRPATRMGADEGPASVRASLRGAGLTIADARAELTVEIDSMHRGAFALDSGTVLATVDHGSVRVDSLVLRGPAVTASARGAWALTEGGQSDLTADLTVNAFGPLRSLIPARPLSIGEGTARLTLTGPFDSLQSMLKVQANAILLGDLQLRGLELDGELLLSELEARTGSGTLTLDGLVAPVMSVGSTTLALDWAGDDIAVDLESAVDERRTLEVRSRLDPRPETRALRIESFGASLDDDVWTLTQPASIRYGGPLVLEPIELTAANQRFYAEGTLSDEGPQQLELVLENFNVSTVADLLGFPSLQGTIGAALNLAGTPDEPTLESRYRLALDSRVGAAPVNVTGVFDYAAGDARVEAELTGPDGGTLDVTGTAPARLALPWVRDAAPPLLQTGDGPVDLTVSADSLSLRWLRPFLDPVGLTEVAGVVNASIDVQGTAADPDVDGGATLSAGRLRPEALGTTWERIGATVSLDGSAVRLDSLRAYSAEGSLTATGSLALERLDVGAFDLEFESNGFRLIDNELARATASGEGRIAGTTAQPELTAELQMLSTDVYLDALQVTASASDVELTEEDYQQLQATFGRDYRQREPDPMALMDSLALNVSVSLGRDTWVRQAANPRMALQMTGNFRVEKARRDSLQYFGQVEAIPERSFIEQFGRRFQIARGDVELRGKASETHVDILAEYGIPSTRDPDQAEVTIQLGVTGTPSEVEVTLGSEPSMDNSDIVSYLATGRPASQDVGVGESSSLSGVGTGLAVGAVANALEAAAADQIGLDVVDIQTDGLEGARLVAGRYVSPSLFVGFEQPLSRGSSSGRATGTERGSQVQLEYQAIRWLLLNLELGGRGFDFLLRSRYAY